MLRLTTDVDETRLLPCDAQAAVRAALAYADKGMWEQRVYIGEKRITVRKLVREFGLAGLVNYQPEKL